LKTLNRFDDLVGFLLQGALQQRNAILGVEGILVYKVVRDGRSRFAEHVGNDSIKGDIANGEGVLEAILFARLAGNELEAIPCVLPQNADVLRWDKAAGNQTEAKEIADPLGVFDIILVALHSSNPLGVGDGNADAALQQIVNGNIILPGTLHANVKAVVINQPLLKSQNGFVKGGKAFLFVTRNDTLRCDERGDEKCLVYIDATTDGVNDSQNSPSLQWYCEGEGSNWITAHLTLS